MEEFDDTNSDEILTKEEVLEKSRKENAHGDERVVGAIWKAGYLAMSAGLLICSVLYLLYYILKGEAHFELFFVYSCMQLISSIVQYCYTRRKIMLAISIAFAAVTVGLLIFIVLDLAGIDQ